MNRSFHNIETIPNRGTRHPYRIGYSNIGVVRIFGKSGDYSIYMGNSVANCENAIDNLFVCGHIATLAHVSEIIKTLAIAVIGTQKRVLVS